MIENYMERLVDEVFEEVLTLYGDCMSEKCVHNIKSTALNNLPPSYFDYDTEDSEKKAFLLERQRRITVLAQVADAAETVCCECGTCSPKK